MADEIGLFEAMYTQRAIRSFRPDPIPRDLIEKMLEAATKAPSGGNAQPWAFVVVQERSHLDQLAAIARRTFGRTYAGALARQQPGDPPPMQSLKKMIDAVDDIPAWIIVCLTDPPRPGAGWARYASIFPAVQNLLLAARGLGLGAVLTGLLGGDEQAILKGLLGVPDDVEPVAFIPVGFPKDQQYGPTSRRPLAEVVHWEQWESDKKNTAKLPYRQAG
jgi:nitroreductase